MSDTGSISESDNPIEAVVADDAAQATRGRYGWLSLIVAFLFALFYVYDLWEAVGTMFALPAFYDAYGIGAEYVPWWLLWIGVLLPITVYLIAFIGGRRRNVFGKALIFLVGLAVVAGFSLGVIAFEEILRPVALISG
jgi:hypothetical protein